MSGCDPLRVGRPGSPGSISPSRSADRTRSGTLSRPRLPIKRLRSVSTVFGGWCMSTPIAALRNPHHDSKFTRGGGVSLLGIGGETLDAMAVRLALT